MALKTDITRRGFIKILAGGSAAVGLGNWMAPRAHGAELTKIKFTLPWIPEGEVAFAFIAKKLGFWEKRGLDVQVDRGFGSGEAAKNVAIKMYDFGYADTGVMINSIGKGLDLMSIGMVQHKSPLVVISLQEKGIKQPKDLEGKTLGSSAGSGAYLLFPAFAKATGLDESKIKTSLMNPDMLTPALIEGRIDARAAFYQSIAPALWARGYKFNIMFYSSYGLQMYSTGLIARPETVKSQPDLCSRFVDGAMEGLRYTYLNPDKSLEIFMDMVPEYKGAEANKEVAKHSFNINTALGMEEYAKEKGLGWMEPEIMDSTRKKVIEYMGIKEAPETEKLYTNNFVGKIKLSAEEWAKTKDSVKKYMLWEG